MSNKGTFYVKKGDRLFYVEPISKHADRSSGWNNGIKKSDIAKGGGVHPDDSIITDENFKNIVVLEPGQSPLGYIDQICDEDE